MSGQELRKLVNLLESIENNQQLDEGFFEFIKSKISQVFGYIANIFNKIGFGQRVEINLGDALGTQSVQEDGERGSTKELADLTSVIGYYNEYCVAYRLANLLEASGVNIRPMTDQQLKIIANNYKKRILQNVNNFKKTPQQVQAELQRVEDGSEVMAKKLYEEVSQANDLKLIDVGIELTGESAKGAAKEDIKVVIYKKGTEKTKDVIKASLKIYKGTSINMANLTFPSYLVNIITNTPDTGGGDKSVAAFLEKYPEYADEMKKIVDVTKKWKELKKTKDRESANAYVTKIKGYQQMRGLLFNKIFNDFYKKDKKAINERVLRQVGLDGADEVYMLIGADKKNMVAVSSRTSPEFKKLYESLKAEFNIRFTNPDSANCKMIIESGEGEPLASFTIAFKEGATMPHFWDTKDIVKGARSAEKAKK